MTPVCQPTTSTRPSGRPTNTRQAERLATTVPARLVWKDRTGITRSAAVVTRNVSKSGVYVDCDPSLSIPLFRLVQFEIDPGVVRDSTALPSSLRHGAILSAVYRIVPPLPSGAPQGIALRLLLDRPRVAERRPHPDPTRPRMQASASAGD